VAQLIIVAVGIQFRDSDGASAAKLLNGKCDPKKGTTNTCLFPKGGGAIQYEIQLVFDLADFVKAVDTKDAVVVYDGHSRFGQGPCFGPAGIAAVPDLATFPTNPWGVHYRMGHEATDVECIEDLIGHSILPAEYDLTTATSKSFLGKELVKAAAAAQAATKAMKGKTLSAVAVCRTNGAWREFNSCYATLAGTATARKEKPLSGRHYYRDDRGKEFMTAVKVGSGDLDKSSLPGKLLIMGSCSSHVHFFDALDRRRKATGSSCKFILTGDVCYIDMATNFLELVLIKKLDPTTSSGMAKITKALNGERGSGGVGLY